MAGSADRERITAVPAATPAAAGQRTAYVRHPGDVIRVALGSPGRAARLFGGSAVANRYRRVAGASPRDFVQRSGPSDPAR